MAREHSLPLTCDRCQNKSVIPYRLIKDGMLKAAKPPTCPQCGESYSDEAMSSAVDRGTRRNYIQSGVLVLVFIVLMYLLFFS